MDSYTPQGGMHPKVGHDETEINLRGIIVFITVLVISAIFTFIVAWLLMRGFEKIETTYFDKKATPAQQQLQEQRGALLKKEGVKPPPDWYERSVDEKVLEKTFPTPRLQYADEDDMKSFLEGEEDRLGSTGKDADGSIHIPIERAIDLLSDPKRGLPQVNGTFTPGPALGNLTDVSDAAQRRLNQAGAGATNKK